MVFKELKNMFSVIKQMIQTEITKMQRPFDLFVVVSVNPVNYTAKIRNYWQGRLQFDDVQIAGVGLGNFDGMVKMPQTNDLVLVAYLSKKTPIIIGNLFTPDNNLNITADVIPQIKEGETLIVGKRKNSYIFFNSNGDVLINSDNIKLSGKNGEAIARVGDSVEVTVTGGSSAGTYSGTITSGSSKVSSE